MIDELANVEISGESDFQLKFEDGKLKLLLGYDGKGMDAGVYMDLEPDYFLDKLAEAIPGDIDDKIIEMVKLAFKVA